MTEILLHGYSSESDLQESYQMNTNMTGFRCFSKIFVLWTKVASALEGLRFSVTYQLLLQSMDLGRTCQTCLMDYRHVVGIRILSSGVVKCGRAIILEMMFWTVGYEILAKALLMT